MTKFSQRPEGDSPVEAEHDVRTHFIIVIDGVLCDAVHNTWALTSGARARASMIIEH